MIYSDDENEYGFSAKDVNEYRNKTGAGMMEAKAHFMKLYKIKLKYEMIDLLRSGSQEDINKVVRILVSQF